MTKYDLRKLMADPVWRCEKVIVQNLYKRLINAKCNEDDKAHMQEEFLSMLERFSLKELEKCFHENLSQNDYGC